MAGSVEDYLQMVKKNRERGSQWKLSQWQKRNLINWLDPISRVRRKIPEDCDVHDLQRWCYETAVGMEFMARCDVSGNCDNLSEDLSQ